MKTTMASTVSARENRRWLLIDAENMVLGRLSSEIAMLLMGKNKPSYTPHIDTGDYVIVINADKVKLTGKKLEKQSYVHHTLYAGGRKDIPFKTVYEKHPERMIMHAVKGMLPKNSLGRQMLKKLRVYVGAEHGHEAQQPEKYEW